MANESIMAKRLRQMVPYLQEHNPTRYRRFSGAAAASPKAAELSEEERNMVDTENVNEDRREIRRTKGGI